MAGHLPPVGPAEDLAGRPEIVLTSVLKFISVKYNDELSPAPQSAGLERGVRHSFDDEMCTNLRVVGSFFDTMCDAFWLLS